MQYRTLRRVVLSFAVMIVAVGSLTLFGCGGDDDDDDNIQLCDANNVNNLAFVFGDNTVFTFGAVTLSFTNNGTRFTLQKAGAGGGTATGTVSFNPFSFAVTSSTFPAGTSFAVGSCTLDVDNAIITITNLSGASATSAPGTPTGSSGS